METALRETYSLTQAEARLAAYLADGSRLDDFAAGLGISKETARTQLKAVFVKTRTGRQAELVALLAAIAPRREG
jgi:DNA-binding CsgD family transcriptional regulator